MPDSVARFRCPVPLPGSGAPRTRSPLAGSVALPGSVALVLIFAHRPEFREPRLIKNVLKSDYFLMNDRNGYLETYWADLNDFFTG